MTRWFGAARWLVLAIAVVFGADLAAAQPKDTLSPKQKKEVETLIRDYLKKNPGLIIELLQDAQRFQEEQEAAQSRANLVAHREALYKDANAPVGGNPKGDVTIVEFFDYKCPYCKNVVPTLVEAIERDKRVRIVFKELPVLGPESVIAARAALAARKQNKYGDLHFALMGIKGGFSEAQIFAAAEGVGIDLKRLREDMRAKEIDDMLIANRRLASMLGIRGTPGFVIGDNIIRGAIDGDALAEAIADARAKCMSC